MDDDIPVPPWVLGDAPWPDGAGSVVYLDNADDIASITGLLELWYELAAGLLPLFAPGRDRSLRPRLSGMERDPDRKQRKVRPKRWGDGLTADLFQLTAYWEYTGARPGEVYDMSAYAFRFHGRRHLQLSTTMNLAPGLLADTLPAMLELTRRLGDVGDAAYGEVTVNRHPSPPSTNLDSALRRLTDESAEASRTYLRGYEWVTVVPRELVQRLGGADAIRASGAFVAVTPFGSGGALLRATDDPREYSPGHARRVFEALRPVLPPGQPRKPPGYDLELVVFEDAHA